jgi:hypothetical protein
MIRNYCSMCCRNFWFELTENICSNLQQFLAVELVSISLFEDFIWVYREVGQWLLLCFFITSSTIWWMIPVSAKAFNMYRLKGFGDFAVKHVRRWAMNFCIDLLRLDVIINIVKLGFLFLLSMYWTLWHLSVLLININAAFVFYKSWSSHLI